MTLGRRLASTNQEFDPNKQLVIRLKSPGTISGSSFYWRITPSNLSDTDTIEIIQDPYNFLGVTSYTDAFPLKKKGNYVGSGDVIYTVKLSEIQGAVTSNDARFQINMDITAIGGNAIQLSTNVTPNGSQPYYSTATPSSGWPTDTSQPINGANEWSFYSIDRDPPPPPVDPDALPDMPLTIWIDGFGSTPLTVNSNFTIEIRRSDIT